MSTAPVGLSSVPAELLARLDSVQESADGSYLADCPYCRRPGTLHLSATGFRCAAPLCDTLGPLVALERKLDGADAGEDPEIRTLADTLADPDALRPPEPVVPRLAWAERVTLLAAREKLGKSTLASAAAAAKTRGHRFLGEAPEPGSVLIFGLEEHLGDLARRLVGFDADPHAVYIVERTSSPLNDLSAAVGALKPALTVVDTLAAFTASMDLDPGSSSVSFRETSPSRPR